MTQEGACLATLPFLKSHCRAYCKYCTVLWGLGIGLFPVRIVITPISTHGSDYPGAVVPLATLFFLPGPCRSIASPVEGFKYPNLDKLLLAR